VRHVRMQQFALDVCARCGRDSNSPAHRRVPGFADEPRHRFVRRSFTPEEELAERIIIELGCVMVPLHRCSAFDAASKDELRERIMGVVERYGPRGPHARAEKE
jgi:hypothetical protein